MPAKNIHSAAFDESTISKLEIFENYAEAWIPTFVMQKIPKICIFDFFAGAGYDTNNIPGSTIRILHKIKKFVQYIFKNKVKIILYINEYEPNKNKQTKFIKLKEACEQYLNENSEVRRAIEINFINEDFHTLFPKLINKIKESPSLVYLDQNGVSALSNKYLLELEKCSQTDFIYFVSSSYILRFGNTDEFKNHINIDVTKAKKDPYKFIHKNIIEQLRSNLPKDTKLKLYPFSLKKSSNIYGIIFGASHIRAVDKFLSIAWKHNNTNGEANFDIHNDNSPTPMQLSFFEDRRPSKVEQFQLLVREKILSGQIVNNFDLLDLVFKEGHIGKHADVCLRKLKQEGAIHYEGLSPLITYDNVYKNKRQIQYQITLK